MTRKTPTQTNNKPIAYSTKTTFFKNKITSVVRNQSIVSKIVSILHIPKKNPLTFYQTQ